MIRSIQIHNFRNYKNSKVCLPEDGTRGRIVVLFGENGSGKTNFLESISLMFESHGLRKAKYEDMICRFVDESWWNILIETDEGSFSSGYVLKDGFSGSRIYKVNGKNARNLNEFRKDNYVVWITYETDRLFLQSPSERRGFVDMFCNVKCNEHSQNLKDYEKLTKERLKVLKKYSGDHCLGVSQDISRWLDIIEDKIADLGIKIALQRQHMVKELEVSQVSNGEFPKFRNTMKGRLEDEVLHSLDGDLWRSQYKMELTNRRQKDGITGSTTFGPNRSDWIVYHEDKQIAAAHCSAGEQKMLLSGAFFAFILQNLKSDRRNLIVLFDDVIAHLDKYHRDLLFKYTKFLVRCEQNKVSVWFSGTSKDLFQELSDEATFFRVESGNCYFESNS